MDTSANEERAKLINQAIGADTFEEINEVRRALAEYLRAHPGDGSLEELQEQLRRLENELEKDSAAATAYLTTEPNQPG